MKDWLKKNIKGLLAGLLIGGSAVTLLNIDIGDRSTSTDTTVKIGTGDTAYNFYGDIFLDLNKEGKAGWIEFRGVSEDAATGNQIQVLSEGSITLPLGFESKDLTPHTVNR